MLNHLTHVVMCPIIHTYASSVWDMPVSKTCALFSMLLRSFGSSSRRASRRRRTSKLRHARCATIPKSDLTLKQTLEKEVFLQDMQPFTHHNLRRMQLRRHVAESLLELPLCRHMRIRSHS